MPRQIFRNRPTGQGYDDIYTLTSNSARYLGPTEFGQSFSGQQDVQDLGIRTDLFSKYFPWKNTSSTTPPQFPENLPPPESDFSSSSAPVTNAENSLLSQLQSLGTPSDREQGARDASQKYLDELQRQIDAFETRRTAQIDLLNKQFDAERTNLETAQGRETGTTQAGTLRIGGYLGGSGSEMGVLQNLANTHKLELSQLEAKRAAAINDANVAVDDKQFALAQQKVKEVKDVEQEIEDRRNTFFTQSMQMLAENRLGTSAKFDIISNIPEGQTVTVNGQNFVGIKKEKIDPFFTGANLISLMNSTPRGETASIVDPATGQLFTVNGTADPDVFTVENNAGTVTGINKLSGKVLWAAKNVGKTKDASGSGVSDSMKALYLQAAIADLEANKGSDNHVSPDTYTEIRNKFITLMGTSAAAGGFDDVALRYVNPDQRKIFGLPGSPSASNSITLPDGTKINL